MPPVPSTAGGLSPTTPTTWSAGPPPASVPSSWAGRQRGVWRWLSALGLIQTTHYKVQSYLPKLSARTKIGSINYNIFRYVWIFLFVTSAVIVWGADLTSQPDWSEGGWSVFVDLSVVMIITITSGLELFLYPAAVTRYSDQTRTEKPRNHDGVETQSLLFSPLIIILIQYISQLSCNSHRATNVSISRQPSLHSNILSICTAGRPGNGIT